MPRSRRADCSSLAFSVGDLLFGFGGLGFQDADPLLFRLERAHGCCPPLIVRAEATLVVHVNVPAAGAVQVRCRVRAYDGAGAVLTAVGQRGGR